MRQFRLRFRQRLFGAFVVFDVGVRAVPANRFVAPIPRGNAGGKEVPVLTAGSADTPLAFKRLSGRERLPPRLAEAASVVRVYGFDEPFTAQLVQGTPDIVQKAFVAIIDGAIRGATPNLLGNHLGKYEELMLGLAQL